jgi:uncharacterized protein
MKKIALRIVGFIVLLYVALAAGMYTAQRNMIYITKNVKPSLSEFPVEDVVEIPVPTKDGLTLHGWYKPPKTRYQSTIVRIHGNASNVLWNMEALAPYIEQGYGALSVEYRGYAQNPGKPDEEGLYNDVRAYMDWLVANGTNLENIIVYGESLGTGPAVQAALDYPKIQALILQTPYTSLPKAAATFYPFLPTDLLIKDRYDNLSKIKLVKAPIIIVHGTDDGVVSYKLGKELFDAANEPKSLITIEGGRHNDLEDFKISEKILSALSE